MILKRLHLRLGKKQDGDVDEAGSSHLGRPRRALRGGTLSHLSYWNLSSQNCPWTPLEPPRPSCLFFMPDPRLMRQQGQRSWLRAFMLWTSLLLDPLNLDSHAPGPCLNPSYSCFADCSGPVRLFYACPASSGPS